MTLAMESELRQCSVTEVLLVFSLVLPKAVNADHPLPAADIYKWVRQTLCALHGHDLMLHFEPGRVCLRCVDCDHETPGWRTR